MSLNPIVPIRFNSLFT